MEEIEALLGQAEAEQRDVDEELGKAAGDVGGTVMSSPLLAIWAEAAALVALALGISGPWVLVPVVLALVWMSLQLIFS